MGELYTAFLKNKENTNLWSFEIDIKRCCSDETAPFILLLSYPCDAEEFPDIISEMISITLS